MPYHLAKDFDVSSILIISDQKTECNRDTHTLERSRVCVCVWERKEI